jgi:hypothetical protein
MLRRQPKTNSKKNARSHLGDRALSQKIPNPPEVNPTKSNHIKPTIPVSF